MRLRALDLFCGGGGACIGMMQAGFEVTGIDIKPHRNYPGHFIQGDIHDLPVNIFDFDFVWASPPCQQFSIGTKARLDELEIMMRYPNFIPITKKILKGHPYTCIENVPRAPIRGDLVLNGPTVGLMFIMRKRKFELSFWITQPLLLKKQTPKEWPSFSIAAELSSNSETYRKKVEALGFPMTIPQSVAKMFMGIPCLQKMTNKEICEAVAPPMAYYISKQVFDLIQKEKHGKESCL